MKISAVCSHICRHNPRRQTTRTIISNKGDIAGALKELGSKENVKGLATAIVTAGLVQGLGVAFNLPTGAGTDTTILQKLQTNLINGVAGSLVSTAINGGSLEDALKNAIKTAIISSVAAQGAGIIGDMKVGDNPALNQFTGSLAHAILGCAVGSATAGNSSGCAAGAGGAVVGELSAEWYGKTFGGNPADAANFAKLTTAIAGLAGGANAMNIAGITSNNAVTNNFLNHTEAAQMRKEIDICKAKAGGCTDQDLINVRDKYIKVSNKNMDAVTACVVSGDAACVQKLQNSAASAAEVTNVFPIGYGIGFEDVFKVRQDNINIYGSIKGKDAIFGSDLDQAKEVALFRKDNCQGMSSSSCDAAVKQAIDDRYTRALILGGAGSIAGIVGPKIGTKLLPPIENKLAIRQLIKNAESLSSAKPDQSIFPRDFQEQTLWNRVKADPVSGKILDGMNSGSDFPNYAGFQKMQATHLLPNGESITIHYQYNKLTDKIYDMKFTTPQPTPFVLQPGATYIKK
jgi:hypothetical protein